MQFLLFSCRGPPIHLMHSTNKEYLTFQQLFFLNHPNRFPILFINKMNPKRSQGPTSTAFPLQLGGGVESKPTRSLQPMATAVELSSGAPNDWSGGNSWSL